MEINESVEVDIKKINEILNTLREYKIEKDKWDTTENYHITLITPLTSGGYKNKLETHVNFIEFAQLKKLVIDNIDQKTLELKEELRCLIKNMKYEIGNY